jgi:hypothetical protein
VQLLQLLLYMLQLAPAVCKDIGNVRAGVATVQWADANMKWLRMELLGGAEFNSSSSSSRGSEDAAYAACLNYQLALQTAVGFALPCLLLYCCEALARHSCCASRHDDRHQQQQQQQQGQQQQTGQQQQQQQGQELADSLQCSSRSMFWFTIAVRVVGVLLACWVQLCMLARSP